MSVCVYDVYVYVCLYVYVYVLGAARVHLEQMREGTLYGPVFFQFYVIFVTKLN